ncbi:post-illumination chlorophyll fluorescenceincrease [Striga asiatica]|uniref:Post-illumination chlorophyll fluorescenceincrease n=1 Tax=Striga asiatica TaxID=4170 RepID=A0A5A7R6Q4_STRAF|nr:post-illumination chlorophyll fluorescenceincrease [Striga asiatica]
MSRISYRNSSHPVLGPRSFHSSLYLLHGERVWRARSGSGRASRMERVGPRVGKRSLDMKTKDVTRERTLGEAGGSKSSNGAVELATGPVYVQSKLGLLRAFGEEIGAVKPGGAIRYGSWQKYYE